MISLHLYPDMEAALIAERPLPLCFTEADRQIMYRFIDEVEEKARAAALEEAAKWHDEQAGKLRKYMSALEIDEMTTADRRAAGHEASAAAIRALVIKGVSDD